VKSYLWAMVAAVIMMIAPAAYAAPNAEVREFLRTMAARAEARVAAAGVRLTGTSVKVRAQVGVDGRLGNPAVVRSSGSRSTDAAVEVALRRMPVYAPAGLTGRSVTLTLGRGGLAQLDPPSQDRAPTGTRIAPPKPRAGPPLILRPDAGYLPSMVSSSPGYREAS
jgi:TonB family protein